MPCLSVFLISMIECVVTCSLVFSFSLMRCSVHSDVSTQQLRICTNSTCCTPSPSSITVQRLLHVCSSLPKWKGNQGEWNTMYRWNRDASTETSLHSTQRQRLVNFGNYFHVVPLPLIVITGFKTLVVEVSFLLTCSLFADNVSTSE